MSELFLQIDYFWNEFCIYSIYTLAVMDLDIEQGTHC